NVPPASAGAGAANDAGNKTTDTVRATRAMLRIMKSPPLRLRDGCPPQLWQNRPAGCRRRPRRGAVGMDCGDLNLRAFTAKLKGYIPTQRRFREPTEITDRKFRREERAMHKIAIPSYARRGRSHPFENLDPTRTALVVVDLQ